MADGIVSEIPRNRGGSRLWAALWPAGVVLAGAPPAWRRPVVDRVAARPARDRVAEAVGEPEVRPARALRLARRRHAQSAVLDIDLVPGRRIQPAVLLAPRWRIRRRGLLGLSPVGGAVPGSRARLP